MTGVKNGRESEEQPEQTCYFSGYDENIIGGVFAVSREECDRNILRVWLQHISEAKLFTTTNSVDITVFTMCRETCEWLGHIFADNE